MTASKHPFFRTMLTEDDADSVWCPMRVAFWIGFLTLIVLVFYSVIVKSQPFDVVAFGTGAGGLLTGAGIAIFFNGRSAPK